MPNDSLVPVNENNASNAEVLEQFQRLTASLIGQQVMAAGAKKITTRIQELIEDTENDADSAETELMELADNILEFSDIDINHSLGFCKHGGLESIKSCLDHSSYAVRAAYLDVIANLSQNNEEVQQYLYENADFIKEFLNAVVNDNVASIYRAKLLFAISSLVRGNAEGRRIFYQENGVKALEKTFSNSFDFDDTRVVSRTAIVANHIYQDTAAASDEQNSSSMLKILKQMKVQLQTQNDKYSDPLEYLESI
uniref:Nucleotide exchange factor Fes1 domain-containing protein n=1 Tax=Panagrolaimus sp. JU765 TaxID=591449 RepID=A0AC34PWB1_9BILA